VRTLTTRVFAVAGGLLSMAALAACAPSTRVPTVSIGDVAVAPTVELNAEIVTEPITPSLDLTTTGGLTVKGDLTVTQGTLAGWAGTTTEVPAPGGEAAGTTAPPSAAVTYALIVANHPVLGDILVDGAGRTVYAFLSDSSGVSKCEGACLDNWPPVPASEPVELGPGVDRDLLGTLARTDGTPQMTYAGRPLYYFVDDTEPGLYNGQGVNRLWYVVSALGQPVRP
jgi:predicted lipoprotein with Yx(FWY)xxD motif